VKIVLVSDTHLAERGQAYADNWAAVRSWIAGTVPDLVVHLGDITADGISDARQLEAAFPAFEALGSPTRFLPGNHDIGDNPIEPDATTEHPVDLLRLAEYRRIYGPDHWSFRAGPWQIIGLNAQIFGTGGAAEEAQFDWLEAALRHVDGPLGVMLHKPLFRTGPSDTEAHVRYVPRLPRQRLLSLLGTRDLRFVVSGHTHQARSFEVDGVEHVWAPSTAFCIPDAMQEAIGEKRVGVLTLELTDREHRFHFVTPDGVARHNLLDHPEVYPVVAALKAKLGAQAAL
jgi:3',5'-cyclic AMP phosphodiesterase CpdA